MFTSWLNSHEFTFVCASQVVSAYNFISFDNDIFKYDYYIRKSFPQEKNKLFETFFIGWKVWRKTMYSQGIIIKIKVG